MKTYFWWFPCLAFFVAGTLGSTSEKKLLTKLLEHYNTLERPVKNFSETLLIKLGATLLSLQNVNEKEGTIETVLWLHMKWTDNNLQWIPEEYDGIDEVKIPVSSIWKPDVHGYNSRHEIFDATFETKTLVKFNGSVLYVPPGNHKTSCNMDFTLYPFDKLDCELKFGSWTHHGYHINLTLMDQSTDNGDLTSFIPSLEWDVIEFTMTRNEKYYKCCPEPYVDLTWTLNIQRKGEVLARGYKLYNIFICLMILMSFIASPSSGQKTVIGIGTMFCNIWVISNINSALPQHHTSQLVSYFETLCSLVLSSVIANLITTFIYFTTCPIPDLIRKVFLENMPQILRFVCPRRNSYARMNTELQNTNPERLNARPRHSTDDGRDLLSDAGDLGQLRGYPIYMNDWSYLACMLDRCLFLVYTLCIFIFLVAVYPSFH